MLGEEHHIVHTNWHNGSFTCRGCDVIHHHEGFDDQIIVCEQCGTKMIVKKHPHPCFEIREGSNPAPIVVEVKMLVGGAPLEKAAAGGSDV